METRFDSVDIVFVYLYGNLIVVEDIYLPDLLSGCYVLTEFRREISELPCVRCPDIQIVGALAHQIEILLHVVEAFAHHSYLHLPVQRILV